MSSLLLGDLNDYIQPSVACIKPSTIEKDSSQKVERINEEATTKDTAIVINLTDCLACSGCITSAETVLVAEQTHRELYRVVEQKAVGKATDEPLAIIVSIPAVVRAALAAKYKLTIEQVYLKLVYFFKRILGGVDWIIDTTFAFQLALEETSIEFIERYRHRQSNSGVDSKNTNLLPMLSSECPGWICYAEKKQNEMLEQICTVRSPQQILGALIKTYLTEWLGRQMGRANPLEPAQIYHVAVMSCYDKKLEASRKDFAEEDNNGIRDVDCVITTNELIAMIQERSGMASFKDVPEAEASLLEKDPFQTWIGIPGNEDFRLPKNEGSSAGGYLNYLMVKSAKELFDVTIKSLYDNDGLIEVNKVKNEDYTEYLLYDDKNPNGTKTKTLLLRFAAIYGFRNIQTFIQKAKSKKLQYDFVEIMACPGACLFGGGQPAPVSSANITEDAAKVNSKVTSKIEIQAHRQNLEEIYDGQPIISDSCNIIEQEIQKVKDWINDDFDVRRARVLRTKYHAISDNYLQKNPLAAIQW